MNRLVVAIALVCACQTAQNAPDRELDEASAQVRRFFDAMTKGDCETAASLLPAAREPGACAKLLHEWSDDLGMQLIAIPDVRRDGRDRGAIIVRTAVIRRGQQQTMLIRVTHRQGVWQLVL